MNSHAQRYKPEQALKTKTIKTELQARTSTLTEYQPQTKKQGNEIKKEQQRSNDRRR